MSVPDLIVDLDVVPGLVLLTAEFIALAAVGYLVVRIVLQQTDDLLALAQGLIVGLALWGIIVNVVLYVVPGQPGAAVGWTAVLAVGVALARRAPSCIRPRPRMVAGFLAAFLVILWAAMASRQLLGVQDWSIQLGLAAAMQAGVFPPELPWNPGTPVRYHHGPSLLVGLLSPPFGPDLAFVSELLDAYGWTSLFLVMSTAILRRGSWPGALLAVPWLLTYGAWTVIWVGNGLLEIPVPTGLPQAGLRASLSEIYWPSISLPPHLTPWGAVLPDIWKPAFTIGYALAFVVLQRAASSEPRTWLDSVTLAGLVAFIGLLATTLAPAVLVLWASLEAVRLVRPRTDGPALAQITSPRRGWLRLATRSVTAREVVRPFTGLALAALLLLSGGGVFASAIDGNHSFGLSLASSLDSEHWRLLGTFERQSGGIALLGLGPVVVAGIAVLLARGDRLVLALAAGAGMLALAWLSVRHDPTPYDLGRVAGHARYLALAALLLAMSSRLTDIRPHRRWAVGLLLTILIAWPTLVAPVRNLALAVGNGIQLANANALTYEPREPGGPVSARRFQMPAISERLAAYIRDHIAVDARVLSTQYPFANVFLVTGRPNAAGLAGRLHLNYVTGPENLDAVLYLEPRAFRRMGFGYIHATDAWRATLPQRAGRWLDDPEFFELLARDGGEALYRVRPAFLNLDVAPTPESFEALRSLPSRLTAYLAPQSSWWSRIRIAAALPDPRLVGELHTSRLHLRSPPWPIQSLGAHVPDLVVLPAETDPWMLPAQWRPIWWNEAVAVYAPPRVSAPTLAPSEVEPAPLALRVTDTRIDGERITFSVTYTERAPQRWTSQDWILVRLSDSPLGLPASIHPGGRGPVIAKWFDGLLSSGAAATTHTYRLDLAASELEVRNDRGEFTPLHASGGNFGPGAWALVIRLKHEWKPDHLRDAAFIPVLKVKASDGGEVSLEVYEAARRI